MKKCFGYAAIAVLLLMPCSGWAASEPVGVKPETTALYQKARDQVTGLGNTAAAKYVPELVNQASANIATAQKGLEQGDDRTTRQSSELATLQVKLALVAIEELIAAEKVTATQNELSKLEQQLTSILAGKGEKP